MRDRARRRNAEEEGRSGGLRPASSVPAPKKLIVYGVEPRAVFNPAQPVNVNTHVNVIPEVRVENMSDQELETYDKLLAELLELPPKAEPKRIGGVTR
jgi:hypothetical protein